MPLFLLTAAGALGLDLAINAAVDAWLPYRVAVLGSFAGLERTFNPGVAFGVRFPPVLQAVLIGVALCLVLTVGLRSVDTVLSRIGYGLIAGGAVANILDRIVDGVVTDYIQVGTFPVFNAADSCITIGAFVLLAEAWF